MESKINYTEKNPFHGGISCPRCQNKIVADIPGLLSGSDIMCASCGQVLKMDMQKSASTLQALKNFVSKEKDFPVSREPIVKHSHKPTQVTDMWKKLMEDNPDVKIIWKEESRLMRFINVFMHFGQKNHPFMIKYATTIGNKIYMPKEHWWDRASEEQRMVLLRHEIVHVKQMKKYGSLVFFFLYLFVPLPLGLAYFRAKFEKEGYAETLRARYEYWGKDSITSAECRDWICSQFTGGFYGWMWPFKKSIYQWYNSVVKEIIAK